MKGTIFERGNGLVNRWHRLCAWIRVKRYWLFMPKKAYKKSVISQLICALVTMVASAIAIGYGAYYGILGSLYLVDKVSEYLKKRKEARIEP